MPFKNEYEIKDGVAYVNLHMKNVGTYICKVDEDDIGKLIEFNCNWHMMLSRTTKTYYARATKYNGMIDGKPSYSVVYMHRFLMNCEKGMTIDHLNYDTLDNRRCNLEIVTLDENNKNRQDKANRNSKTGVRNVSYNSKTGKFIVQFQINGKNKLMGSFDTIDEAKMYADTNRGKYYTNVQVKDSFYKKGVYMINEDKLRRVIEETLLKHHKCHFINVRNVDKYMVCPYCGKKMNKLTGRIIKE